MLSLEFFIKMVFGREHKKNNNFILRKRVPRASWKKNNIKIKAI